MLIELRLNNIEVVIISLLSNISFNLNFVIVEFFRFLRFTIIFVLVFV